VIESLIPFLGEVIAERYRLDRTLGQGGMGLVYQAHDLVMKRDVALKVLLPEVAARPDAHKRFEREAKVAAAFEHPHAVRILDFGKDGSRLYLAMELLRGETLQARLARKGPLAFDEIARLGSQMAEVLEAAHHAGLVHRDIKPANFFIETHDGGERVVMLDFGLAFLQNPGTEPGASVLGRLTKEGHAGGTPAYMSPEQACGVDPGPSSDVYAVGCVLFEMVAGRPPFMSGGVGKVLSEHLYAPPPDLRQLRADTPPSLADLVLRMMQKRPTDRPAPADIRARLSALLEPAGAGHDRTRDLGYLPSRSERMVTTPMDAAETRPASAGSMIVAVDGALDPELRLALQANDMAVVPFDAAQDGGDVVFAPDADVERLRALVADGRPVVTATGSMDGIAALLRIGVTDVVLRPVRADDLARKLKRALRRQRRRAD
jgi:serine/threonine-protein kinase